MSEFLIKIHLVGTDVQLISRQVGVFKHSRSYSTGCKSVPATKSKGSREKQQQDEFRITTPTLHIPKLSSNF